LQVTLAALTAIPFGYGLAGMLVGPRALPGNRIHVDASFDSEYRFVHAFWFSVAPVIWSGLPRIEEQPVALRAAMGAVVVGGFARLRSWRQTGRPRTIFIAGIVLELVVVPGLWVWLQRVGRAATAGERGSRAEGVPA
jgi:hypothetical protein